MDSAHLSRDPQSANLSKIGETTQPGGGLQARGNLPYEELWYIVRNVLPMKATTQDICHACQKHSGAATTRELTCRQGAPRLVFQLTGCSSYLICTLPKSQKCHPMVHKFLCTMKKHSSRCIAFLGKNLKEAGQFEKPLGVRRAL